MISSWRELRVGVVELRREVRHSHLLGVFDDAGSDGLAQAAEGFVDEFVVHRPFGDGLRL